MTESNPFNVNGLSDKEVETYREQYGRNTIHDKSSTGFWQALKITITEPMFLILLATCIIYFLLGEKAEAFFMLAAIIVISAISFYQDTRSRKALAALKAYTQAQTKIIRNGKISLIPGEEIVVNDFGIAEEGTLVPADGEVIKCNDFSVNESILTGEAFSVSKDPNDNQNKKIFQGTQVVSGLALYKVTNVGAATVLGKIGTSLETITEEKTPLQEQITEFVRRMAIAGVIVFILILGIDFYTSHDFLESLLLGLTLAMSILPEEIPVAFTSFMALGAWRLMKSGVIVKQTKTVETLGAATVICVDKTGTITQNKMQLSRIYVHESKNVLSEKEWNTPSALKVISTAMWASETLPFDPMEIALHDVYGKVSTKNERPDFKMIHEYPLSGKPPMMTHVFENANNERIIACKGAAESIIEHSTLTDDERTGIMFQADELAKQGYRVLGVAETSFAGIDFPEEQQLFNFNFLGLIAFYDPPKNNITEVFNQFYEAGIQVKIITGDNALTTSAIAKQIDFKGAENTMNGEELLKLSDAELTEKINKVHIFTRMFPEAKLRIINALKKQNHIVAMTGDGVNDGPALKAAHIGIAMGKRGSELAKEAASLILTDDDLEKMVEAIAAGRRIYCNLKKAIQYIISIHIPIILTVTLPFILGWIFPTIFSPVHIIFLELIMGPTCSIVYENESAEKDSMQKAPRLMSKTFLSWKELSISIWQGLFITAGTLFSYRYAVHNGFNEDLTRALVFSTLVIANIFLTMVNRSFYYSILTTITYKNRMMTLVILSTFILLLCLLYIPVLQTFFHLDPLNLKQFGISCLVGFVSVIWFEIYKWGKRRNAK